MALPEQSKLAVTMPITKHKQPCKTTRALYATLPLKTNLLFLEQEKNEI